MNPVPLWEKMLTLILGSEMGARLGVLGRYCGIPLYHNRISRYDGYTKGTSLIRNDLRSDGAKWWGSVTGPDGCQHCLPINDTQVIKIDTGGKIAVHVGNKFKNIGKSWGGSVMKITVVRIRFL